MQTYYCKYRYHFPFGSSDCYSYVALDSYIDTNVNGGMFVLIQRHYFVYHYVALGLPIFFTFFWWRMLSQYGKVFLSGVILIYFLSFLLIMTPLQKYGVLSMSMDYRHRLEQEEKCRKIERFYQTLDIPPSEEILYLEDGQMVWWLGNKSACRYYFPLPVQRNKEHAPKSSVFEKVVEEINKFAGNGIIIDTVWFPYEREELQIFRENLKNYQAYPVPEVPEYIIYKRFFKQ